MSTATLPSPAQIQRAAADETTYLQLRVKIRDDDARRAFDDAVSRAYTGTRRPLTDIQKAVIEFSALRFPTSEDREQAIRDRFHVSAVRYQQVLGALIDRPEALRAYPEIVRQLLAQRDARRTQRSARTETAGSAR